jgi:hypothetical protein
MKTLQPRPLTDTTQPWGVITFIHSDGKEHTFYSAINKLSGSRLTAFDNEPPSVDDDMPWIKSVFRSIRRKAKVTGYGGTKHFA